MLAIAFLLIIPVGWLIYVNSFSSKLLSPLMSVAIGGSLTVLVTAMTILKESRSEDRFATSIYFNNNDNLPEIIMPSISSADSRRMQMHMNLSSWGRPQKMKAGVRDGNTIRGTMELMIKPPANKVEKATYGCELIRYAIIKNLRHLYVTDRSYSSPEQPPRVEITTPPNVKIREIKVAEFLSLVPSSVFKEYDREFNLSGETTMLWPEGLTINQDVDTNDEELFNCYKLIIDKKLFFTVTIEIKWFSYFNVSKLPEGSLDLPKRRGGYQAYYYTVNLKSVFHWVTAANPETENYQRWVKWLFDDIKRSFEDKPLNISQAPPPSI